MTTLALTGATTVVAAMATDAWGTSRTAVAGLFRREGQDRQTAIEGQLDSDADLVAQDDDAEGARRDLVPIWHRRLATLLNRQYPGAADDLRVLIAQMQAALPPAQQQGVQTNIARDNGQVFASRGGNVLVDTRPDSDRLRPPPSAAGSDEGSGQAG
ncbi:hypothetical protein ACH5A3_32740 [Streptomyces echinatus]|uniref:hypothetical protein n=1 Tax=Streptomyces echinatus TaxID=67293 RepID=UPI0037BD1247